MGDEQFGMPELTILMNDIFNENLSGWEKEFRQSMQVTVAAQQEPGVGHFDLARLTLSPPVFADLLSKAATEIHNLPRQRLVESINTPEFDQKRLVESINAPEFQIAAEEIASILRSRAFCLKYFKAMLVWTGAGANANEPLLDVFNFWALLELSLASEQPLPRFFETEVSLAQWLMTAMERGAPAAIRGTFPQSTLSSAFAAPAALGLSFGLPSRMAFGATGPTLIDFTVVSHEHNLSLNVTKITHHSPVGFGSKHSSPVTAKLAGGFMYRFSGYRQSPTGLIYRADPTAYPCNSGQTSAAVTF